MTTSRISLPRFSNPTHPSIQDWDTFKDLIIQLYIHERRKLSEVQSYLRDAFNFDATPRMFKRRFAEWNICKVVREQDATRLEEEIATYRAVHHRDPPVLQVNGRFVDTETVKRSLRRHRLRSRKGSNESALPDSFVLDEELEKLDEDDLDGSISEQEIGSPSLLTSEELGSLSVAILQTDYHREELQLRKSFNGAIRVFTTWAFPTAQPLPFASPTIATLPNTRQLLELESVLFQSKRYYDNLESKRRNTSNAVYQCSCKEATQARDFYARYWLGLILGASNSARNERLASSLYDGVFSQTGHVLKEDHPHFLPWICFVISYPRRWAHQAEEAQYVQEKTLSFAQWMTESIGGRQDPRFVIQQQLARSSYRRDIALVLLHQILDTFRQRTQGHYIRDLQLLAQLFDHVNKVTQLDGDEIDTVLQNWAGASLSIAEVIHRNELERVCNVTTACLAM